MLRSSNPILSRQDAFTPAAQQYNQNPYDQSRADARYPSQGYPHAPVEPLEARMTFDDVVTKTALTIGVLVISAALAWMFVPQALYFPALIGSGLIGFIGKTFGDHDVNIAQMNVGREQQGGEAIGVVNLDNVPGEDALEAVRQHKDVLSLSLIKLPASGQLPGWLGA